MGRVGQKSKPDLRGSNQIREQLKLEYYEMQEFKLSNCEHKSDPKLPSQFETDEQSTKMNEKPLPVENEAQFVDDRGFLEKIKILKFEEIRESIPSTMESDDQDFKKMRKQKETWPLRKAVLANETCHAAMRQLNRLSNKEKYWHSMTKRRMVLVNLNGVHYKPIRHQNNEVRRFFTQWVANNVKHTEDPVKMRWRNVAVDFLAMQQKLNNLPMDTVLLAVSLLDYEMAKKDQGLLSEELVCHTAVEYLNEAIIRTYYRLSSEQREGVLDLKCRLVSRQELKKSNIACQKINVVDLRIKNDLNPAFFETLCKSAGGTPIELGIGLGIMRLCDKTPVREVSPRLLCNGVLYLAMRISRKSCKKEFKWDDLNVSDYKENDLYYLAQEICLIMKKPSKGVHSIMYYVDTQFGKVSNFLLESHLKPIIDKLLKLEKGNAKEIFKPVKANRANT